MTNVLVHYAMGVTIATLAKRGPKARWAWGLAAVAPDVDALTNLLLKPTLGLTAWPPWAAQGLAFIFAHRGLFHTLAPIALLTLILAILSRRREAMLLALLLGSHLTLDALSPWPLQPLWPISSADLHVGLLRVGDATETAAAAITIVALVLLESLRSPPILHARIPLFCLALLFVPYAGSGASALNASLHAPGIPNIAHYPEYQLVERDGIGYHVWLVDARGTVYERTDVRRIEFSENATTAEIAALQRASCEYDHMGPFRWTDAPTFSAGRTTAGWVVTVTDARAQQDPSSVPMRILFDITPGGVERVQLLARETGFHGEVDLDLPGAIATHKACVT